MLFSKSVSRTYKNWAKKSHRIESYVKLASLIIAAGAVAIACNKSNGNTVANGVGITNISSGGISSYGLNGSVTFSVTIGDGSGLPGQNYVLTASSGIVNGDLRQIGQNVYEVQTTCANTNCTDVAFLIIDRNGYLNTTGTYSSYLGTNPLVGDGVNYPYTATSQYVLTSQSVGSVEYLYRAAAASSGAITWNLVKTLTDTTGTVVLLNSTQLIALEQP